MLITSPYTAYFENARKDKGTGVMINPNDPEQNPEAFMKYGGNDDINFDERNMNSDQSSNSSNQQSYKSDRRKSINARDKTSNFSPPSPSPGPNRPRYGYNPADDIVSHRSASVPMFGAWDEKDPEIRRRFYGHLSESQRGKTHCSDQLPTNPSTVFI
ncbi:putative RPM1-interacting protein 4/NOI4 [Helianthus annuus]|nr:putative RPM1-interacting protein 4/NOI4 [Helianthus annuus]